jgi:hypothetical protein
MWRRLYFLETTPTKGQDLSKITWKPYTTMLASEERGIMQSAYLCARPSKGITHFFGSRMHYHSKLKLRRTVCQDKARGNSYCKTLRSTLTTGCRITLEMEPNETHGNRQNIMVLAFLNIQRENKVHLMAALKLMKFQHIGELYLENEVNNSLA